MANEDMTRKIEIAHERWLKEQDLTITRVEADKEVKIAQTEAKKAIQEAKYESDNWSIAKVVAYVVVLAVVISVCITYCGTQPPNEKQEEIKQQRYELCMQVEQDHERCTE